MKVNLNGSGGESVRQRDNSKGVSGDDGEAGN